MIENSHKQGWISCVSSIYNADFFVSGANDGYLHFYEGNFSNLKTLSL